MSKVDRHKAALRENLKKRKAQARDLGKKTSTDIDESLKIRSAALKPKMQIKIENKPEN